MPPENFTRTPTTLEQAKQWQEAADAAAAAARKALGDFTAQHSYYFMWKDRTHPKTGALLVQPNRMLDRQSMELFEVCRRAEEDGHAADQAASALALKEGGFAHIAVPPFVVGTPPTPEERIAQAVQALAKGVQAARDTMPAGAAGIQCSGQLTLRDEVADKALGQKARNSRYSYDSKLLADGWQQYDTSQDASYFGVWVHTQARMIFTFAEGDRTLQAFDTDEALSAELTRMEGVYGPAPAAFRVYDVDAHTRTDIVMERPRVA